MTLKNHTPRLRDDEAENLRCGLDDHHFARGLLRAVGPEERERFSDEGWAYGDPSAYYGSDPFEVMRFQANVVAKTLLGSACSADLHVFFEGDGAVEEYFASLQDDDGYSLEEQDEGTLVFGEYGILVAEVRGDPETVWRLKGALAAQGAVYLHYNPLTEIGGGYDKATHVLLVYDMQLYPAERETIHHEFFELLVRAWKEMNNRDGD